MVVRHSREYVGLTRDRLLVQIFHEYIAFVLPDLEPSRGTGLAGVSQEIYHGLVVDFNKGGLQGTRDIRTMNSVWSYDQNSP